MAEIPLHSCSGLFGLHFSHVLLAFWCAFVGSGSAVNVTQTPSFAHNSPGQSITLKCSVNEAGYRFFWYQQLPGKTELTVLGYLSAFDKELQERHKDWQNRLEAKWEGSKNQEMRLDLLRLQASDTGFYLCAAVYTVNEKHKVLDSASLSPSCFYVRLIVFHQPVNKLGKRDSSQDIQKNFATENLHRLDLGKLVSHLSNWMKRICCSKLKQKMAMLEPSEPLYKRK